MGNGEVQPENETEEKCELDFKQTENLKTAFAETEENDSSYGFSFGFGNEQTFVNVDIESQETTSMKTNLSFGKSDKNTSSKKKPFTDFSLPSLEDMKSGLFYNPKPNFQITSETKEENKKRRNDKGEKYKQKGKTEKSTDGVQKKKTVKKEKVKNVKDLPKEVPTS